MPSPRYQNSDIMKSEFGRSLVPNQGRHLPVSDLTDLVWSLYPNQIKDLPTSCTSLSTPSPRVVKREWVHITL